MSHRRLKTGAGYDALGRTVTPQQAHRACWDKRSFPGRPAARDAASKALKYKDGPQHLHPYRCHLCGLWHLTSMDDEAIQRMRDSRRGKNGGPR